MRQPSTYPVPAAGATKGPDGALRSRRGFLRTAGIALTGGTVLGIPATAAAQTRAAPGQAAAGVSLARQRSYHLITETVTAVRGTAAGAAGGGSAAGTAQARLAAWYAAADPAGRARIDAALDTVAQLFPPDTGSHDVSGRLHILARHLTGPHSDQLTAAIGLAVTGLNPDRPYPADPDKAGQVCARTIRTMAAQPPRPLTFADLAAAVVAVQGDAGGGHHGGHDGGRAPRCRPPKR